MTFDEFKYLAENPLQYYGKAVFRLDTYCYTDEVYEDDNLSYTLRDDSVLQDTYWRENGSEKDHIVTRVAAIDKRFRPDGPSLRPETFLPFYAAKEYIEASVSVNLTEDKPLDKLIDNLLHQYPDIFQRFTGFIINFINTDIKNWKIKKVDQYRWWKTLKEKYPNLSRINKVKHHTCQRIGGEQYTLEIIAFK